MADNIDWSKITEFFNGVIEESKNATLDESSIQLEIHIYSKAFDETMRVVVPSDRVEEFMKRLGLWEARVYKGHPLKV